MIPPGNLTSTKILDTKAKQTAGQVLTLDESYQLTQQTTFDGKIVKFAYDRNGMRLKSGRANHCTRVDTDSLNRLVAVVTPDGQRLTHDSQDALVEEYEHAKALILDRRDTGLTFGAPAEILSSRPLTGLFGTLQFLNRLEPFSFLPRMEMKS